jgi:hypothetical protein
MVANPPLPKRVRATLAKRVYRMHQFLFDELRAFWLTYPEEMRKKICALGWEPPRPAADENQREISSNNSGEDYLFMHCQMIAFANSLLADEGDPDFPRVEGWVGIPGPDDPDFPVPPPFFPPEGHPVTHTFLPRAKARDFYERRIIRWERTCGDAAFLKTLTLGELGTLIEGTLHDAVRNRWAAAPAAIRPDPPTAGEPIWEGWDDPDYDYLRDMYGMHVNPIFWKFFGWVQDRVEDWKVANGIFGRDFWTATWIGKMPEDQPPSNRCPSGTREAPLFAIFENDDVAAKHLSEMEQVVSIIAEAQEDAP